MKAKLVFIVLILAILMPVIPVWASQATRDRLRELEAQRNYSRQRVNAAQNLLGEIRGEMADVMAEIQELDQLIVDVTIELENIEMALLGVEIRIADAEDDLVLAMADRDLQYEMLRARVRAMHESGPVGALDALFQATSFSDFLMRMEEIRALAQFDQEMLGRMEDAEARVVRTIDSLHSDRLSVEDLQFQRQNVYAEYRRVEYDRKAWFARLAEDEAGQEMITAMLAAEQHALDVELGVVQRQFASEQEAERRAREAAAAAERMARLNFDGQFHWPVPTHARISSYFGSRIHPISNRRENHSGIDIPAPTGTRINASAGGYVRFVGWSGGYGNTVIIDHGGGYSTLYAHNSRNRVVAGQRVEQGQHIADVGSTGVSTGPHLHFEIRRNNTAIDPLPFVRR